jgi:membrane-associated protease RseP (regulator of RpoE activity)
VSKLDTIKNEMAAGGSVVERDAEEPTDPATAVIGIGAWVALFVLLAYLNVWFLVFVVGLLVSVFLHECGHFWTARRSGMKVTQFFMGFGPRIWSFHRNGIEYGLRAIPLGAFVRIIGMNNLDEVPEADEAQTYRQQSFPKRLLVISAGSLMHMLIAIVLVTGVYVTAGRFEETGRVSVAAAVEPGTPAFAAGLRAGDQITEIDGIAITSADDVSPTLRSIAPGTTIELVIIRNGVEEALSATVTQRPDSEAPAGYLGIRTQSMARVDESVPAAVVDGGKDLVTWVGQAVTGVVKVLNPISVAGHLLGTNDDASSRPGTIVGATRISDDVGTFAGWAGVIEFLAAVNVSVGVFNMFPLLPLDGGHAAIAAYERIRSRRGRRYVADVAKLMPVLAVTIAVIGFMFLTGLYLDIAKPPQ